ncbi:MAG: hypothetical protein KBH14_00580 [Vicinamibacteria bacterium]|jgi:hypothetical protein|nr:hypothetical protein [Vicinamibacteria bacterium]MBP9944871.1 hypothetical protein [Vicinamibacteria bacterium]
MTDMPSAICEVLVRLANEGSPTDQDRLLIRFTTLLQEISGVHSASIAWARGEARVTIEYDPGTVTAALLSAEIRRRAREFPPAK